MPRVEPAEFESLPLEAFRFIQGFALHDVWLVELEGAESCTVPGLRRLVSPERLRTLNPIVRTLFFCRSVLGRLFDLDTTSDEVLTRRPLEHVPSRLSTASAVPPGTPAGPFQTLYLLPDEAAYQVVNATVHAILVVAVTASGSGHRFFWATYVKPVGRITSFYLRVIDPFRRIIVYPGLESWLKRAWQQKRRETT